MRVKILFNKKENALVQMSDSTQAQLGNLPHTLSRLLATPTYTPPVQYVWVFLTEGVFRKGVVS